MKKSFPYKLSLVAIAILFIIQSPGCKKTDDESPPANEEPEIIVAENTKVILEEDWEANIVSIDTGDYTITFHAAINDTYDLSVDDIVISSKDKGLIRRITSITEANGLLEVETIQAHLAEAIPKGNLKINFNLSEVKAPPKVTYIADGVRLLDSRQGKGTQLVIEVSCDFGTDYFSITGELEIGDLEFEGYYDWHMDMLFPVLDTVYSSFSLTETFTLTEELTTAAELDAKVKLITLEYPTIMFIIAGVPVPITPEIILTAGVLLEAECSLSAGLIQELTASGGAVYDGGDWSPYFDLEKNFQSIPPELTNSLSAKVYVRPQLNMVVYKVFKPNISVEPYASLEAEIGSSPWWFFYLGIKSQLGMAIDLIFANLLDYKVTLFDKKFEVANSGNPGNYPPEAEFTITPESGFPDTEFVFDASGCSDEEDPVSALEVRWDFESDNIWDTDWNTEKITTRSYDLPGTYQVRLQVRDTDGATGSLSNELSVTIPGGGGPCPGTPTVTDGDGNVYNTVQIGNQCWMRENLVVGTMIMSTQEQSDNGIIEKYCYDDHSDSCLTYGGLYRWDELMNYSELEGSQGICPLGWHVPTYNEYWELIDLLGGDEYAGGAMKESGTEHWMSPNEDATNCSGFTALPGGKWDPYQEVFKVMTSHAFFWTSTIPWNSAGNPNYMSLHYHSGEIEATGFGCRPCGYSVRCIKDE